MPPDSQRGSRVTARNIVTAASPEAVQAGLDMLRTGGNAADAAAAVLLVSCVTQLGAVCFGGEAAVIVFDAATGTPIVLAAQGAAPLDGEAMARTLAERKRLTGVRAATTPAILDLCVTLLHQFGSKSFEEAASPAIELLERGRPAAYFDSMLRTRIDALSGQPAADSGEATPPREWWRDAADALRTIAAVERATPSRTSALESAADVLRHGEIADRLAAWYQAQDGFLRKRDLESHRTARERPLSVSFGGHDVCKPDTWTQGAWLLQALQLLAGEPLPADEIDRCHLIAEVIKLSMADRDRHYGDPLFTERTIERLLSPDYATMRRGLIDRRAARPPLPGDPIRMRPVLDAGPPPFTSDRSTIACITADRSGNVVVMTPSGIGSTAGSGGTTGITHGTRLFSAIRLPNHPNTLAPGKRPCVTLSPTLVLKSGKPIAAITLPGGNFQDQIALQLVLHIVHEGWRLDEILQRDDEATPVLLHATQHDVTLRLQRRVANRIGTALLDLGHVVEPTPLSFLRFGGSIAFFDSAGGAIDAYGLHAGAI